MHRNSICSPDIALWSATLPRTGCTFWYHFCCQIYQPCCRYIHG